MINIPFDKINKATIDELISNGRAESKTLEYKRELPGRSDGEIKEFLADVSSFGNASGGHIIYGISEKKDENGKNTGLPDEALGIVLGENMSIHDTQTSLENVIRDNISPRLKVHTKPINGFQRGPIIIIYIPKSFSAPHMITKGAKRFYSRHSTGKYPLDVGEIRLAFVASETLPERIRQFRLERLSKIIADETPDILDKPTRIVFHFVPIDAFSYPSNSQQIDFRILQKFSAGSRHYNIDGYLCSNGPFDGRSSEYFQFFRNSIIEWVNCRILGTNEQKEISGAGYERSILEKSESIFNTIKDLMIEPPILIMASLLNVKGYKMYTDKYFSFDQPGIDRDIVIIPEIMIEDLDLEVRAILKPIFDMIWQACGLPGSPN